MTPNQNRALTVRLDDETIRKIERFAEDNTLVNEKGEPNISVTLRVLIALALNDGPEKVAEQLWQSAKGQALREVAGRVFEALRVYRDE
jgi:hypothetical protein